MDKNSLCSWKIDTSSCCVIQNQVDTDTKLDASLVFGCTIRPDTASDDSSLVDIKNHIQEAVGWRSDSLALRTQTNKVISDLCRSRRRSCHGSAVGNRVSQLDLIVNSLVGEQSDDRPNTFQIPVELAQDDCWSDT